jgi:tetratricopeptide (TPR) repeat protein
MKLGRYQDAALGFQSSLQIRPTAGAARNLAAVFLLAGQPSQATQVYRLAMQIDPGDLQNQRALAWLLATHPDDHVRNGREALALAQQIVTQTNSQVPLFLLTLSAAWAEAGDFTQATSVALQAAQAYRNSGDAPMAQLIQQKIVPALNNHQALRDNPVKSQ